jgi:thioredoxin reductase
VVGAGPYGLSVAAHLKHAGVPTLVYGKPMEFWEGMPPGMFLRSAWSASSLSAPDHAFNLDHYVEFIGQTQRPPLPLPFFIDYGLWFQRNAVPEVDATYVQSVTIRHDGFQVDLADGRSVSAGRVIVAAGIRDFAYVPEFAGHLSEAVASHTGAHHDFSRFNGLRVAVVGGGQSARETAALLSEAGAEVELIIRGTMRWLKFHDYKGPGRRFLYAPSDVGPPGLNWLLHFPLVFRHLPLRTRLVITRRAVKPAAARWLLHRLGRVKITTQTAVTHAMEDGAGVRLLLSDGSTRHLDHLVLGTGYRPTVHKLSFISEPVRDRVRLHRDGFPVLNRWLESSVPGLHFVGGLADRSYGPICRFVSGADIAARQIAAYAARS